MSENLIIGASKSIQALNEMIVRLSKTKTNVLVIGESGTGKELVAKMIHQSSGGAGDPFVPVNCGAIPENLVESEFFGHKKGSFTGAVVDRPGLFEAASGGTLFLDEVGEIPLAMQVKLLRALQERVVRRVGGTDNIKVDVRIIAATNRELEAEIKAGRFREDLYYRLNVVQIRTPSLRERPDDIPILAEHLLKKVTSKNRKVIEGFEPDVLEAFCTYSWPGNVRELENVMERAVALESGLKVSMAVLPHQITLSLDRSKRKEKALVANPIVIALKDGKIEIPVPSFLTEPIDLDRIVLEVEKYYIKAALAQTTGNKEKAAELLGITYKAIQSKIEKSKIKN